VSEAKGCNSPRAPQRSEERRVKITFQGGQCMREVVAIFLLLF